jgi:hypothetical protein
VLRNKRERVNLAAHTLRRCIASLSEPSARRGHDLRLVVSKAALGRRGRIALTSLRILRV